LYYNESLVQMEKATKNFNKQLYPVKFKDRGKTIFRDAITGDATLASREKGEKIFDLLEDRIINIINLMEKGKYFE